MSNTTTSALPLMPALATKLSDREPLDKLLKRLEITEWDWLLIGDGSASNWKYGCGWASTSITRETMDRKVWFGVMNYGTVNIAEMMAYLQPLEWYATNEANLRKRRKRRRRIRRVHIVTDSEYCRDQARRGDQRPKHHGAMWRMMEDFQRKGILLTWHWRERDDVELNRYADALSKAARLFLKENDVQKMVVGPNGEPRTPYEFNP